MKKTTDAVPFAACVSTLRGHLNMNADYAGGSRKLGVSQARINLLRYVRVPAQSPLPGGWGVSAMQAAVLRASMSERVSEHSHERVLSTFRPPRRTKPLADQIGTAQPGAPRARLLRGASRAEESLLRAA
jgi:hypothetical protein